MLITIDANVLISAFRPLETQNVNAIRLLELARLGMVQLQITSRIENDIPRDPFRAQIEAIPNLPKIGSVGRVGYTSIGNGDVIVDETDNHMLDELMSLIFPGASKTHKNFSNKVCDVDHLFAHSRTLAAVFVTNDGPVLKAAKELEARFAIRVMSLAFFLDSNEWPL